MNICVAVVEALRKKERQDETQFRVARPIIDHLVSEVCEFLGSAPLNFTPKEEL
jgi:hypothetical protein